MARHIPLITRSAKLSEDFGYDYACRLFGKEAIDSLPILASGKNKGRVKGTLYWRVATEAGYVRECCGVRGRGQLVEAWIGESRQNADRGLWCGRIQGLAGSYSVLCVQYRDREAEQQAARDAEMADMRAKLGRAPLWEAVA